MMQDQLKQMDKGNHGWNSETFRYDYNKQDSFGCTNEKVRVNTAFDRGESGMPEVPKDAFLYQTFDDANTIFNRKCNLDEACKKWHSLNFLFGTPYFFKINNNSNITSSVSNKYEFEPSQGRCYVWSFKYVTVLNSKISPSNFTKTQFILTL